MRVVSKKKLRVYWEKHRESEKPLEHWYREMKKGNWESPHELKNYDSSVSVLERNRVIFNLRGNRYRIVTWINFRSQVIFIRFVGTHAEYDLIDANNV